MTISFNSVPGNIRVPIVAVEFDNTRALRGTQFGQKLLVLGQRLTAGTVAANIPTLVSSAAEAETFFGRGSMLAAMFKSLKAANRYTETWAIALDDNGAGVQATGTITVTGTATASGTLHAYVAGTRVDVAVASGTAQAAIATALAAAITADTSLPVTAVVNGVVTNQVDITARHKGEAGNGIDLRVNYYTGEALPAGLSVAIVAMTGGTTNPAISTAITAMGEEWYTHIVMPYTDASNLTLLETELTDRWGPIRANDALAFTAFRGTLSATTTFGTGRNHHLVSCMDTGISPQPPYIWAAVYGAVASYNLGIDPARPLQTLVLTGIMPPAITARRLLSERNTLLWDGIATHKVDAGGQVVIDRAITMYRVNAAGAADPSYLDTNTPATLSFIRHAVRTRVSQKFPRHKLANDGTRFGAGQAVVTPSVMRNELIALFLEMEAAGLAEGFSQFKADLVVERNASDPNRLDVLMSPDLVNQLVVTAVQIQFLL